VKPGRSVAAGGGWCNHRIARLKRGGEGQSVRALAKATSMRFTTPYSVEECIRRIEAASERDRPFLSDLRWSSGVLARVSSDRFRLRYRRFLVRNSFAPILDGRIESTSTGSLVHAHFRWHRAVLGFAIVWFSGIVGIGGVMFVVSAGALVRGENRVGETNVLLGLLFPVGLLAFGITLVRFGQFLGRTDRREILSFIQRELKASEESGEL